MAQKIIIQDGVVLYRSPDPAYSVEFTVDGDIFADNVTAATFSGSFSGNATTATALQNARTFSVSGDASGTSLGFDGTANATIPVTLSTVNSNVGTYGSSTLIPVVTVNNKGLITSVSSIAFSGTAPLATSLAGGSVGAVPYQSAINTTSFLTAGTNSQVMVSGAAPSWTNTPTLTGTNFTGIPNVGLINSSLTIGSTNISLGATATVLTGLSSVTSTNFVGTFTGASSLNVLKAGDTMTGALVSPAFVPSGATVPVNGLYLPAVNAVGVSTDNTERIRVTSTGNVGIGTTAPARLLEVSGSTASVRITGTSATAAALELLSAGAIMWSVRANVTGSSEYSVYQDSTERMRITSSGFVGVNTNPLYPLDVDGIAIAVGTKTPASGSGGIIRYRFDTGAMGWVVGVLGGAAETAWSVYNHTNAAEYLRINQNPLDGIISTVASVTQANIADQSYSVQTPTNGFSLIIGNNVQTYVLNPSGALATGTVTMPATPLAGQIVYICTSQTITTLTISANSGQTLSNAYSAALSAGTGLSYIYIAGTWFRRT